MTVAVFYLIILLGLESTRRVEFITSFYNSSEKVLQLQYVALKLMLKF